MLAPTPTPTTTSSDVRQCILRILWLKAVSTQILTASEKINAGKASSICVSQMIAVGMSHGHLLVFDSSQTLKWCWQECSNVGSVSSLSFNNDDTRLLAGFALGK